MEQNILEKILQGSMEPTVLPLELLWEITDGFSAFRIIGEGGFGTVYKGTVGNRNVAVKRIRSNMTIDYKLFHREVNSLMEVNHKNVVRFLGFCAQTIKTPMEGPEFRIFTFVEIQEIFLCFDYINNGSLDKQITDELRGLEWDKRYEIIKGICTGLHYLHREKCILHMDLKPANILLDNDMLPKLTDFGLSRHKENLQTSITNRILSCGYCAPENLFGGGKMSLKSDIYSLGIIIIELVTGNKGIPDTNENILRRWRHRWNKSKKETSAKYHKQVTKCIEIASLCQRDDPYARPSISEIMSEFVELESMDNCRMIAHDLVAGQIKPSHWEDDMLTVEPLELRFANTRNEKQLTLSCSVELSNDTDSFISFNIQTTSPLPYSIEPNKEIVKPQTKCSVEITLPAANTQDHNNKKYATKFIVQSIKVNEGLTTNDLDEVFDRHISDQHVHEIYLSVISEEPCDQEEEINSMKSGQVPMLSYLTGSMNSLVDKLTEQKNGPMFGTLHEDLMTLKKDFDKLAGNGGVVVNPQVKVWIKQVREVVFDIEDWIDGPEIMGDPIEREEKVKEFGTLIKEACSRCKRYDLFINLGDDVAGLAFAPSKIVHVDSQLLLGDKSCDIVGLGGPKQMLKEHLLHQQKKLKVVSILGIGGLGKTTIAMELHGELQPEFPCGAFVYVGRNPSVWTILVNILHQSMSSSERKGYFKDRLKPSYDDFLPLHEREHEAILENTLDEQQIIALLWKHLSKKRYLIVLDGIWSIRHWRAISGALPDNNLGSRILTTTRIRDIAESCSPGRSNVVHQMKALSEVDSNRLFFGENGRPADHEILKICGGIPLAIILAAAALKYEELVGPKMPGKSIFSSPNQYSTSEGMAKILHMIYADLSVPVRSCLLYLSLFPEGYTIKKNRLIQLWGAEGFIPEEHLWRTGERYWNELIRRRLIQPVFRHDDYEAVGCTVHGVILDFVRSLSREENFATMASELSSGSFLVDTIRRFSLDCSDEDEARVVASSRVHLSSIRSLTVFLPSYSPIENLVPASKLMRVMDLLPDFKLMRVLDLEDTRNLENRHLSGIGGFVLLRYLAIGGNGIDQLPEDIGKLMQLETLDLRLCRLPASIVNLENLMHLHIDMYFTGKEMSQELQELDKVTNLLRYWNRLRMLGLTMDARYLTRTAPRSMASFFDEVFRSNLESLYLHFPFGPDELLSLLVDSWKRVTPATVSRPRFLARRFELIISEINLNGVPPKMASLLHLTHLRIKLFSVDEEVFRILGGLPKLLTLNLSAAYRPPKVGGCIITEDIFQCLKAGFFRGQMGLVFQKRAMPQLQMLSFHTSEGHLYDGIEQLTCVKRVHAVFECYGATDSEIMTWEARIKEQVARNPNKPALEFIRAYEEDDELQVRAALSGWLWN